MTEINDINFILKEMTEYLNLRYDMDKERVQELIDKRGLKTLADKVPTLFFDRSPEYWGEWLIRRR